METLDDNYLNYHHQMIYQPGDQPIQQSHQSPHYLQPDSAASSGQQCLYQSPMHNKSTGRMAPPINPMPPLVTSHAHPNGLSAQQQHSPNGGNHMNFGSKNANYVQPTHYQSGLGLQSPLGSPNSVVEQQQQPAVSNYGNYVSNNSNLRSEIINISNTLTHISDTDSSNYPTPPMPQAQLVGRTAYQTPTGFNSSYGHIPQPNQWSNVNCVNKTTGVDGSCSKTAQQIYSNNNNNANRAFHQPGSGYEMPTGGHGHQQQQQYPTPQVLHHGEYQHSMISTPVVTSKDAAKFHANPHTGAKVGGTSGYFYNGNQVSNIRQHQQQTFHNSQRQHRQSHTTNGFRTNGINLSITKEKSTTQVANDTNELMPDESVTIQDFQNLPLSGRQNVVERNCSTYERRNLIIFKVVEQLIDPITKRVIKENIIKNDEITTSIGLVHVNGLMNNTEINNGHTVLSTVSAATSKTSCQVSEESRTTSVLSSLNQSVAGSSDNFADISSNAHSKSSTEEISNQLSVIEDEDKSDQVENIPVTEVKTSEIESKVILPQDFEEMKPEEGKEDKDKEEEEERRQTASALLSLKTPTKVPCTPPPADDENTNGPLNTPVFIRHIDTTENVKINFTNILSNEPVIEQVSPPTFSVCSLSTNVVSSSSQSNTSSSSPKPIENKFYGYLKETMKVLAKWKDRKFYAAELSKKIESGKWMVKFDDGASRNLSENEIVQPEALCHDTEVMVNLSKDDDGAMICQPAKVIKFFKLANNEYEYELEHLNQEQKEYIRNRYKLSDIILNSEQGTQIISRMAKPSAAVYGEVDLDNIVTGKRSRAKQVEQTVSNKKFKETKVAASPVPAISPLPTAYEEFTGTTSLLDVNNNNKKQRKVEKTTTIEIVSVKAPKKVENKRKRIELPALKEQFSESSTTSLEPPKKIKPKIKSKKKIETLNFSQSQPGELFRGIAFLLIPDDRVKDDRQSRSDPFDKRYLSELIRAGGGSIFKTFNEMKASDLECLLISDTYHRSVEYIQCLAGGVSILSHLWVVESSRKGQLQPKKAYFLPAGYDEITHTLSSYNDVFKRSSNLFRDAKIYFGSSQPDKLENSLAPILKAARAVVVKQETNMHTTLTKKVVDIIVADGSCQPELVSRAKAHRVPVVSTEYIIQCLINGKRLSPDASPTFSYTYQQPN